MKIVKGILYDTKMLPTRMLRAYKVMFALIGIGTLPKDFIYPVKVKLPQENNNVENIKFILASFKKSK